MSYVSDDLMTKVWRHVGASGPDQILTIEKRHRKDQKALTKFVYGRLLKLREDAAGVGLYTFHVLVEAFSRVTPKPKTVRRTCIDRVWDVSATLLKQEARNAEPFAVQYLEDALAEDDDVVLSDEERSH